MRYCLPDGAIPCCLDRQLSCPTGADTAYTCRAASGLTYTDGGTPVDANLCVELNPSGATGLPDAYCAGETTEDLVACHTAPDSAPTDPKVGWEGGDCDGDGTANAADPDACTPPPNRGVATETGCQAVTLGCTPDTTCFLTFNGDQTGDCEVVGGGTLCVPTGGDTSELYCADGPGGFDCLPDSERKVSLGGARYCVPDVCAAAGVDLTLCISGDDGDPVPWDDGDCDGDGESNRHERDSAERDPCVDESMVPADGGAAPGPDGGPAPADAGSIAPSADGGAPIDPNFEGGGGCACRAAPGRRGGGIALALLGLALALRRRG